MSSRKPKQRASVPGMRAPASQVRWSPLKPVEVEGEVVDVFENGLYRVKRAAPNVNWPTRVDNLDDTLWLVVNRLDGKPVHDWRHLQRIKNELAGPEREALELYPAESRLVDMGNAYHLWVLPAGERIPFGHTRRVVAGPRPGIAQRAFEP